MTTTTHQAYWVRDGLRESAVVMERPNVVLTVKRVPEGPLEVSIAAVFQWPGKPPKVLLLRRELWLPEEAAWTKAKRALERAWFEEHCAWGEPETLREMFRKPTMTATELAELRAKQERMRMEAIERAGKRYVERQEMLAKRREGLN